MNAERLMRIGGHVWMACTVGWLINLTMIEQLLSVKLMLPLGCFVVGVAMFREAEILRRG